MPGLRVAGDTLRAFLEQQLDNSPKLESDILRALTEPTDVGVEIEDERLQKLRELMGELLEVDDVGPV